MKEHSLSLEASPAVSTPPRVTGTAVSTYGSFSFPAASADGAREGLSRMEADLAQREAEVSRREADLTAADGSSSWTCLPSVQWLNRPLWQEAPLLWQPIMRRLWQFWLGTTVLLVWNCLCAMVLESAQTSGGTMEKLPMQSPVQALVLLFLLPVAALNAWLLPLLHASQQHGSSSRQGGFAVFAALVMHTSLCGFAAVSPPGFGIVGLFVALHCFPAGHLWLFLCTMANTAGWIALCLFGAQVVRGVQECRILEAAAAEQPLPTSVDTQSPSKPVAYGRI